MFLQNTSLPTKKILIVSILLALLVLIFSLFGASSIGNVSYPVSEDHEQKDDFSEWEMVGRITVGNGEVADLGL